MNEVIKYQCEKCGKYYDTASECQACETVHVAPVSVAYMYTPKDVGLEAKYPHTAVLTMTDGTKVTMKIMSWREQNNA